MKVLFSLGLWILLFAITSCNRYIDSGSNAKEISLSNSLLKTNADSNLFIYKNAVRVKADDQLFSAKSFSTPLPKGLKWCEILNSDKFSFFYNSSQVILISIDLEGSGFTQDTSYVPSEKDIQAFVSHYPVESGKKFDVRNVEFKQKRNHLLVKRQSASILLYNILPDNYAHFIHYIDRFKFL